MDVRAAGREDPLDQSEVAPRCTQRARYRRGPRHGRDLCTLGLAAFPSLGLGRYRLIVATALLTIHHFRRGNDVVAAGFLVFVVGETLIVAGAAMDFVAGAPLFAAGTGLWAASLALVSAPRIMPSWVRGIAAIGALLFTVVAVQVFLGRPLTPLSQPLPFFAYPFLAVTLFGWAWAHYRNAV